MMLSYLWKTLKLVLSTLFIILFFRTFLFEAGRVNGVSMTPAYKDDELFYVNKFQLLFSQPKRKQIVQSHNPLNGVVLLKRIIGIPGDTIHIHDNIITIDTKLGETITLEEPYLQPGSITKMWNNEPSDFTLKRDEYYLIGDNRRESIDSRHFGPVLRKDILGAVIQ